MLFRGFGEKGEQCEKLTFCRGLSKWRSAQDSSEYRKALTGFQQQSKSCSGRKQHTRLSKKQLIKTV